MDQGTQSINLNVDCNGILCMYLSPLDSGPEISDAEGSFRVCTCPAAGVLVNTKFGAEELGPLCGPAGVLGGLLDCCCSGKLCL